MKDDLYQLSKLGVATVYEAVGRRGLIDLPLIQLIPGSRAVGPARTVLCGQDDNLMVHAVIEQIQPGDVLVLTMPEARPVALIGELLATQVKFRQARAILVDAAVRDVDELIGLGLPIWTRYIRATGAGKSLLGELNGNVQVGGTQISSGDILLLDSDGAVCIPRQRLAEATAAAKARAEREAILRQRLAAGELTFDLHGLRQYVEDNKRR